MFEKADALRDEYRYAEAASAYAEGLKKEPGLSPVWVQLGHCLKEAGDFAGAEKSYEKAQSLSPRDHDLLIQMGHLMTKTGDLDRASDFYRRGIALGSQDIHALIFLVSVSRGDEDWSTFADLYDKLLKSGGNRAADFVQLGHASKEAGFHQKAASSYLRALGDGSRDVHMVHFLTKEGCLEAALRTLATRVRPGCEPGFQDTPDPSRPLNFTRLMLDFVQAHEQARLRTFMSAD